MLDNIMHSARLFVRELDSETLEIRADANDMEDDLRIELRAGDVFGCRLFSEWQIVARAEGQVAADWLLD